MACWFCAGRFDRGSQSPWLRFPHPPSRAIQCQRAFITAFLVRLRAVYGFTPDEWPGWGHAGGRRWVHSAGNLGEAADWYILARWRDELSRRVLVDVGKAHRLHRVEVVQVAPVLLEAVRCRKSLRVVTQVILSELTGVVTEIVQELG